MARTVTVQLTDEAHSLLAELANLTSLTVEGLVTGAAVTLATGYAASAKLEEGGPMDAEESEAVGAYAMVMGLVKPGWAEA